MTVQNAKICLDSRPPIKSLKPSGNILLSSLAQEFKNKAAGFILTGMGDDGVLGLQQMRIAGAFTAAQGKRSSVVFGMPAVALRTGAATYCFELDDIPAIFMRVADLLHAQRNSEKYSAKTDNLKKPLRDNPIG
jgi:two-component system chemotaxis response regulator CheB